MNANFIIDYIQKSSGTGSSDEIKRIKSIIKCSGNVLEALGNAKTIRNNNSSRFGKLLEIQFDESNEIVGSHISPYMLETARITNVEENNRSFHIFYQIITQGCQDFYTENLAMSDVDSFSYLNKGSKDADGIDDAEDYRNTIEALKTIGYQDLEIKELFHVIAGVAFLGNIQFKEDSTSAASLVDDQCNVFTYQFLIYYIYI